MMPAQRGRKPVLASLVASTVLLGFAFAPRTAAAQEDATAPLRRFPISIMVKRADSEERVSLLRLDSLQPKDDLQLRVDPNLARQWTFVAATIGAGQRIQVRSWNLWDKKWQAKPVEVGKVPEGDVVPLYFLVLNRRREGRVADAIRKALEASSQQIVSQTASFQSIYQQQNRLLNFMSAYAALGPKDTEDPVLLRYRIAAIGSDLGIAYDPTVDQTQPAELQRGLQVGVGFLGVLRQSPDNPATMAAITQSQLPAVVSDWIGLVGSLTRIFVRPPRQVKLTFVPASASDVDSSYTPTKGNREDWMQFVTERVLDSGNDVLPALVYRPVYVREPANKPLPFGLARNEVLANAAEVAIPLSDASKDLFLHPWAWAWEIGDDGQNFTPLTGARLVAGRGLVFPVNDAWWNGANQRKIHLRAKVGFRATSVQSATVAKAFPQRWSIDAAAAPELTSGDGGVTVRLSRSGPDQPFFRFGAVSLLDAAGKAIPADSVSYDGGLTARFNMAAVSPGKAAIRVHQEGAGVPDEPVPVFVAPRRPAVTLYYGQGDMVLRVTGADAGWVKSVQIPNLFVREADNHDPNNRQLTLSGPLPPTTRSVEVTFRDPERGLEWNRTIPVAVGLPRPKVGATLVGTVPADVPIGAGADPSWAVATLPAGWFSAKAPVRISLAAVAPFAWSHDVTLELGLGSAVDVQPVAIIPEGPTFALDMSSPEAFLTLNLGTGLPPTAKRSSGLIWVRLTRSDLSSAWTLATLKQDAGGAPIRAVKLPTVQTVETTANGVRVTFASADEVLGVRFAGQTDFVAPTLAQATPAGVTATVDGPAGATEFELQIRDASDGFVRVKIVRPQP
jgi:hypothetical protein